jgi:intein-encoded DNA endonuclease-like protein
MKKKIKHIVRKGYEYSKDQLLKMIKERPNIKLNKPQILILFPDLTSNQIKYMTSPRCRHEDIIPFERIGNKPYFIYNQVNAWNEVDRSNNPGIKNAKPKLTSVGT